MAEKTDKIETATATLWMGEDGILRAVYRDGAHETLADAEANVAAAEKLVGDRTIPVMVDMSKMRRIDRDARLYYGSEAPRRYSSAQALIAGSPVSRMIGNFVLGVQRYEMPIKLFGSEEKALEWLREYLK